MAQVTIEMKSNDKSKNTQSTAVHKSKPKHTNNQKAKNRSQLKIPYLFFTGLLSFLLGIAGYWTYKDYNSDFTASNYTYNHLFKPKNNDFRKQISTTDIYISDEIPSSVNEQLTRALSEIEIFSTKRFNITTKKSDSAVELTLDAASNTLSIATLLPVGHLYWVRDDITFQDLETEGVYLSQGAAEFAEILESFGIASEIIENPLSKMEDDEAKLTLILPSELSFKYKLLNFEGDYYLDSLINGESEGSIILSLTYPKELSEINRLSLQNNLKDSFNSDNSNKQTVFTINQTGVTAITRGLTKKIINSGDGAYPSTKIDEFLAQADLTHISNEISFAPNCQNTEGLSFCAREESIEALKKSGVDIVELTGNHNNDFGADKNTSTIEIYKELGWDYFGGGLDSEDASKILYKEINDNKTVAFIGYNYWNAHFGFTGALATDNRAGANPYDEEQMGKDIIEAKEKADTVIVDFQFTECYSYPSGYVLYPTCYKSTTVPNQQTVFRKAIDLGADIVVGTQAHQPQTYEIYNDKVIFYGLGNLYFDQANWPGTQHGLILTHYFIDGNYTQTKITTTNYKADLVTYVSDNDEKDLLLNLLKEAR